MKVTVISLAYSAGAGFDAKPLEEFCATHAVAGWVGHFFVQAGKPELVVVLEYEERTESRRGEAAPRREREPRKELPAVARPVYGWRSRDR